MRFTGSFSKSLVKRSIRGPNYSWSLPSLSSISQKFGFSLSTLFCRSQIYLLSKGCLLVRRLKRVTPHAHISPALAQTFFFYFGSIISGAMNKQVPLVAFDIKSLVLQKNSLTPKSTSFNLLQLSNIIFSGFMSR